MSLSLKDTLRSILFLGMLSAAHGLLAQSAFSDSLGQVAERLRDRSLEHDKLRVAVVEIQSPGGGISPSMLTYIEETLISRLVHAGGVLVVERRQLNVVQDEQRRSASGTFDERDAIELGRLMAADAIITGRVFQVDKKMHLILRLLDTGTGVLLGSAETFTAFPKSKDVEVGRESGSNSSGNGQPVRMKRESPGTQRNSIVELRVMGLGGNYYDKLRPGAAVEIAFRARDQNQGVAVPGKVGIGLQLGYWPAMADIKETPFDIGHISAIRNTEGFNTFQTVRFGSTDMGPGRLFLMSRGPADVKIQAVTGPNVVGTELLEFDRYRLSNVRMDMANFNIPLRWYLSENHEYDNVLKLYVEFGFGMDVVRTQANYDVTSTLVRLDQSDYSYEVLEDHFRATKPSLTSEATNMWFTHFSFGGGLEIGRFNVFATGRWNVSSTFTEGGASFERVRGNILAYPLLVGVENDQRTLSQLDRDGVVPFGATDLERMGSEASSGSGSSNTVTGNGVDRFWKQGHFLFGISLRFL